MKKSNIHIIENNTETKKYGTVDEAVNHFKKIECIQYPVKFEECSIKENGEFKIAGDVFQLTDISFKSLLTNLKMPYNFIQKTCPGDLAVENVNRMLKERKNDEVKCWCNSTDNTVENITAIDFKPIRHQTFLNAFTEAYGSDDAFEIALSRKSLQVVKLFDAKKDPVPNDFFQYGVQFKNYDVYSETNYLNADAFLYRLICKNGYISKSILHDYSEYFKPPVVDSLLNEKIREIQYNDDAFTKIALAVKWMNENEIGAHRNNIFKLFAKFTKKYIPLPEENPFQADNTYYDVFNHATQVVQNTGMPFMQRRVVESWAGALIDAHAWAVSHNRNQVLWADKSIPRELEAA